MKKLGNITRSIALFIAVASFLSVTIGIILLYSHYGPLTPNGNRYHHQFDINTVSWGLVVFEIIAMGSLIYPSIRYGLSSCHDLHNLGVFPSRDKFDSWVSLILTILCVGSQILFSLSFCLTVSDYIFNHNRVMADDLETDVQYFAYCGCILFWGCVNTIYSIRFRFKW